MRVLLLGILALLWVRSTETSLVTVMLVCIGSGSVSVVVSLWLLYGKVSSLGPSESAQDEEPVSVKEVLEDAIPFLAIALTSFCSRRTTGCWAFLTRRSRSTAPPLGWAPSWRCRC
jgi:uncharacterized membrane protein (DUF4010 family)